MARPSGAALAGGKTAAYGGGNLPALGYRSNFPNPQSQIVYQTLVSAGATPEFASQVARAGSARANQIISHLSVGQIYQMLGRVQTPGQLLEALNAPTGGILGDILGPIGALVGGVIGAAVGAPGLGAVLGYAAGEAASRAVPARRTERPTFQVPTLGRIVVPAISAVGRYLAPGQEVPPGPGPDGLPRAGRDINGVPILDQETPCPTCGTGSQTPTLAQPGYPAYNQPYGGENPALEPGLTRQPGGTPQLLPPTPPQPGNFTLPPPDQVPTLLEQPNNVPGQVPQIVIQPGDVNSPQIVPQTGDHQIPQIINQLRDQLNQEIQVEQQQAVTQSIVTDQLRQIRDQVQELKQQESRPVETRNIRQELQQKHQLLQQLDQVEQQQQQLNQQTAQQLIQPTPTPAPKPEPVQFCVGCQSQEDAILFLNGESAACSVIPGSTQPLTGLSSEAVMVHSGE
jgi:hypothetical protein